MNVIEVQTFLTTFARRHKFVLNWIHLKQTQILELALAVASSKHYELVGYDVETINPGEKEFVVKAGTRGHPSKYSRFVVTKGLKKFEIHMNLAVRSARDDGIYCLDLAVCPPSLVPSSTKGETWLCLPNESLVTFAEAKKLVVYPMLIAHFIGIVHELTPRFLKVRSLKRMLRDEHFPPTLVSLGKYSGNSQVIVSAFKSRGLLLQVIPNFDVRLANLRGGSTMSPFNDFRNDWTKNTENDLLPVSKPLLQKFNTEL